MKRTIVLLIFSSLIAGSALGENLGTPSLTMRVDPTVSQNGEVSLRFQLRYDGSEIFNAEQGSIPDSKSIRMPSIEVRSYSEFDNEPFVPCITLEERITIDDPSPGYREIKPGQEFVEVVQLSERYEGLKESVGYCDVVVNWSFKMYTEDKVRFPRMAGSVVIPWSRNPISPPNVVVFGTLWQYKQ